MPKILFLSESCLLDPRSGAAHSARAMLQALAGAGFDCHALTLNLCDGETDYPLAGIDAGLDAATRAGSWAEIADGPLTHRIHVAHSTQHKALRPWEARAYLEGAEQDLRCLRPDLVLTYGSDLLRSLLVQAQRMGARTVFYLANAAYAQSEGFAFRFIDDFLVPSQALAALYAEKLKIDALPVGSLVDAPFDGKCNLDPVRIAGRRSRYVTMINPDPMKGGLFFINLAAQALTHAPDLKFRAVASRWGKAEWERRGADLAPLTNIDWHPDTLDMARVYEETALLLVPSLGFEASGRVIAEALLAGIPVLAMRSGGIPEQLNDGGFLFDIPEPLQAKPLTTPPVEDLRNWLQFVKVLMHDDALYTRAVQFALKASAIHERKAREAQIVDTFRGLLAKPALASIGSDERLLQSLAAQRARLRAALDKANGTLEQRAQGEAISAAGHGDELYAEVLKIALAQPALREALAAVKEKDAPRARTILEQYLRIMPEDIAALGMLAEVADQQERESEARRLMERVVELAPGFMQGQHRLLRCLRESGDVESALHHSFALIERAPHQPRYLALHAGLLVGANRFDEAIRVYEAFFARAKGTAHDWMQYALALKTLGRQQEGVDAYRKAIALAPGHGAAWHALSNMKLAVFTDEDIALMQAQLEREDLSEEDRYNIHFTLGKAYEDQKAYAPSFENYAQANRIRRSQTDYDIGRLEDYVVQAKETFTREFFAQRSGWGHSAGDPIFVVGLHRAGSTLTEQILASHSQIEGTRELAQMLSIGRDFGGIGPRGQERRLDAALLKDITAGECARLGQTYLDTTRNERKTARPLFVDKMPGNWMYAGLIHLILPNARIVDIRRKPMAAGFALFKMNFGRGVDHSYDQRDIARYYRAYAELMAHFDAVLPGRIHHIRYEDLVENTEAQIRRLIDYCRLPFEDACLRYWETERAVQTPSSEQVRQPIYKGALEVWKRYEPWLGPMKEAFAELLEGED